MTILDCVIKTEDTSEQSVQFISFVGLQVRTSEHDIVFFQSAPFRDSFYQALNSNLHSHSSFGFRFFFFKTAVVISLLFLFIYVLISFISYCPSTLLFLKSSVILQATLRPLLGDIFTAIYSVLLVKYSDPNKSIKL